MNYTKVILAAVVIFVCGVVSGFFLSSAHRPPVPPLNVGVTNAPPQWQSQRIDFLRRITKHLDLTVEQREHIEKILQESQKRTKPLWEQIAPQMRQELAKVRDDIRAELNPQQQEKFQKLLKIRPPHRSDEDKNHRRSAFSKKQQVDQSETVTNH